MAWARDQGIGWTRRAGGRDGRRASLRLVVAGGALALRAAGGAGRTGGVDGAWRGGFVGTRVVG